MNAHREVAIALARDELHVDTVRKRWVDHRRQAKVAGVSQDVDESNGVRVAHVDAGDAEYAESLEIMAGIVCVIMGFIIGLIGGVAATLGRQRRLALSKIQRPIDNVLGGRRQRGGNRGRTEVWLE